MPQADQAAVHLVVGQAEVSGGELLARPPVADADARQHATAGQCIEKTVVAHGWGSLSWEWGKLE